MATTPKKPAGRIAEPDEAEQLPETPAPQAPPPVLTSADEQRARSAEIMAAGVENWKAEHDERTAEEKAGNKQVPGVVPQGNPEASSWQGSTRTTQAARHAQNPAAPR